MAWCAGFGVSAGLPAGPWPSAGEGHSSLILGTKSRAQWAVPPFLGEHESPCNGIFICLLKGSVSFCVLMYVFVCVNVGFQIVIKAKPGQGADSKC